MSNSHWSSIASKLLSYRENDFLCDVVVTSKSASFKAHSILLAAVSHVFQTVFEADPSPGLHYINLPEIDDEVLEILIQFVYTGNLLLSSKYSSDGLLDLLTALKDLGLDVEKHGLSLGNCVKLESERQSVSSEQSDCNNEVCELSEQIIFNSTNDVKKEVHQEDCPLDNAVLVEIEGFETGIKLQGKMKSNTAELGESGNDVYSLSSNANGLTNSCQSYPSTFNSHCSISNNVADYGEEKSIDCSESANSLKVVCENVSDTRLSKLCGDCFQRDCICLKRSMPSCQIADKILKCPFCALLFSAVDKLNIHVSVVHKSYKFTCPVCNSSFNSFNKLRLHASIAHKSKNVDDLSDLVMDVSSEGAGPELFSGEKSHEMKILLCDVCGRNFTNLATLNSHRRQHESARRYICKVCCRMFTQRSQLNQHMVTHSGVKPYACPQCGKSFSQKGALVQHIRLHTGEKPFVCLVCGKAFSINAMLKQHLRVHTGEKPFLCSVCDKRFISKESTLVHMRIHTGEKPYACLTCGKTYTQSHHLKGHMLTHTGEKPFACDYCDKAYKNRVDLRNHCNRIHEVDITKRRDSIHNTANNL